MVDLTYKDIGLFATKRLQTISDSSAKKEHAELISMLDYSRNCGCPGIETSDR